MLEFKNYRNSTYSRSIITIISDRSKNSSISRLIPTNTKKSDNSFDMINCLEQNQVFSFGMVHPFFIDIGQIVSVLMSLYIYFQNFLPFAFSGFFIAMKATMEGLIFYNRNFRIAKTLSRLNLSDFNPAIFLIHF